jgi:nucleoside-diphosphate-sugar epimerase
MRIFLAGASGVIGVRLIPLLVAAGNEVAGMTRSPNKLEGLAALGARPVLCDVYDADALNDEVAAFRPDSILDELTDLPDDPDLIPELGGANARIRREGTANLLAAAKAAGATGYVAQSVAWELPGDSGLAAAEREHAVLEAGGVVVRYGEFYGPGTYHASGPPPPPRIHIDEAARRTVPLLRAPSGIVVIEEDATR